MVLTILVWPFLFFFLQSEQTEQLLLTLLILDLVQKACLAYKSEYVHTEIRGNEPCTPERGHLKRSHFSGQQTIHPMHSQAGAYLLTIAAPESSLRSWNLVMCHILDELIWSSCLKCCLISSFMRFLSKCLLYVLLHYIYCFHIYC